MTDTKPKVGDKIVRYVGTADVREIDAAAWSNVNVSNQKKVTWNRANHWEVPASDLTDDALRYLDEDDDGFVVVERGA